MRDIDMCQIIVYYYDKEVYLMNEIESFIREYKLIETIEKDKNFFQIARFPHYEIVSSNVLQYFLSEKIVLKAILSCISGVNIDFDISNDFIYDVDREEITENNNKIDILINTNKYTIGIENKINAGLNNPIEDYYNHLIKLAKEEGKEPLLIVLSKNKVVDNDKYYRNVLYADFVRELKKYYPELLNNLGLKYFFFLSEYLDNIENLQGVNYMNEEFVKIARSGNNIEKISQIVVEAERLRKDLINIASKILDDLSDVSKSFKNKYVDKPKLGEFAASAVFQDCFIKEKYNLKIEIGVDIGWGGSGFGILIYEAEHHFDDGFINILKDILPNLYDYYEISDTAHYKKEFTFEEYDELIKVLKDIFKLF